ncbi:MAG: thioredoxin domain-containing protein [Chthoniobacterales bacterium]
MNLLSDEQSPYLLQHKDNPVHWQAWGEAAFNQARTENKPIFLSIGYSTCHWCHVMAHESFESAAVAEELNSNFISIKLDREERPDIDRIYMAFVQATTGSGGWPMSVWLTPEGEPFFGGTYFPPQDAHERPGFLSILRQIKTLWANDEEKIRTRGAEVITALNESAKQAPGDLPDIQALANKGFSYFENTYDAEHGGFGGAPKFPRPAIFDFLFFFAEFEGAERGRKAREMVNYTLRQMANGGICDHLGGGFHRYSVDETWHVPHFEKMLYDQAQLVSACTNAWLQSSDEKEIFTKAVEETMAYVLRELTHPEGGFFSAEDADSLFEHGHPDHGEGAFYIWSKEEIDDLLDPRDSEIFCAAYDVLDGGNVSPLADPHDEFTGKNILWRQKAESKTDTEHLKKCRQILFKKREERPRPHLDDKVLTAWNGLMISAAARAGAAFSRSDWIAAAVSAASFVEKNLYQKDKGKLLRTWRDGKASPTFAFAEDYAFFIQGLLELYRATLNAKWLNWAHDLQEKQDTLFWDSAGGYFSTEEGDPLVKVRMKESYDGAEPSANSVSAANLLQLSRIFHQPDREEKARQIFETFSSVLEHMPHAAPLMAAARIQFAQPAQHLVITGPASAERSALLKEIGHHYLPDLVVLGLPPEPEETPKNLPEFLATLPRDKTAAYFCQNFTCSPPVETPEELAKLFKRAGE